MSLDFLIAPLRMLIAALGTGDLPAGGPAATLGASKAAMADPNTAQKITGYIVGGVSPLGQKRPLPTVIDNAVETTISRGETVFFSAGKRGMEIEMQPAQLISLLAARCAPIAAS